MNRAQYPKKTKRELGRTMNLSIESQATQF